MVFVKTNAMCLISIEMTPNLFLEDYSLLQGTTTLLFCFLERVGLWSLTKSSSVFWFAI